jgi:oligopeptidase A
MHMTSLKQTPTSAAAAVLHHLISPQDVISSDALRAAVETVTPSLVNFRLRLSQSKPIYNALTSITSTPELWQQLLPEQQRLVTRTLTEMAGNGVGLEAEKRVTFNEIKNKLEQLQNQFSNNVLDAKGVSTDGV